MAELLEEEKVEKMASVKDSSTIEKLAAKLVVGLDDYQVEWMADCKVGKMLVKVRQTVAMSVVVLTHKSAPH